MFLEFLNLNKCHFYLFFIIKLSYITSLKLVSPALVMFLHIVRHLRIISYMRAFLQLGLVKLSRMLERPVEAGAPPLKPSHQVRVRPWLLRLSHLTRSRAGLELCWHVSLTLFLAIARFPSDFTITQSPPMLVASGVFGQLSSWRSWPGMRRLTAVWISR